jgi:uncharacterized membrane protein
MDFSEILAVIALAVSPISELRGAIPVAIGVYDFTWWQAYIIAVIGNILPVPIVLLFMNAVVKFLSRWRFFDRIFQWIFRTVRRRGQRITNWHFAGLMIFVAIPLPITGAWTGSILSVLMKFKLWPSFFAILAGILIAALSLQRYPSSAGNSRNHGG